MATRTYTAEGRTFDIELSATQASTNPVEWAWTVDSVFEGDEELDIPGMDDVTASNEETAYARLCGRIDKWLLDRALEG